MKRVFGSCSPGRSRDFTPYGERCRAMSAASVCTLALQARKEKKFGELMVNGQEALCLSRGFELLHWSSLVAASVYANFRRDICGACNGWIGSDRVRIRLVKDYERYAETLAGFHMLAFACLMLERDAEFVIQSTLAATHAHSGPSGPVVNGLLTPTLLSRV